MGISGLFRERMVTGRVQAGCMMGLVGQISKVSRQFLSKLHDFFTNLHDFSSFKSFMESLLEIGSIFKTLDTLIRP